MVLKVIFIGIVDQGGIIKLKHRPKHCENCGKPLNPYSHKYSDGHWVCMECE